MRIAVFIKSTTFHKGYGGLQTQNKALCEELTKRGHEITVFSPQLELKEEKKDENGVKYIFVPCIYKKYILSRFNKNSWRKKSIEAFEKIHSKKKFNLVLSQSSAGESVVLKRFKLRIPIVSVSHGTILSEFKTFVANMKLPRDFFKLLLNTQYFLRQYFGKQRRFVLGADKVIAVSDIVRESLLEETFIHERDIVTVYNGFDKKKIDDIDVLKHDDGLIRIIFIGRIEKSKGVFILIKMLEEMELKNFKLFFVGGGSDLDELKTRVDKSDISSSVEFHTELNHIEALSKLKESDILVFPTQRVEGFPMVLIESMFAKVPVVAFSQGGVKYGVKDKETGFLIEPTNTEGFKEALLRLFENKTLRESFGSRAGEWGEKEFTIEHMVDEYEKIFEEVSK
ncbi:glycosyltransferase family 4 protein [Patescibacteria group bacterium]